MGYFVQHRDLRESPIESTIYILYQRMNNCISWIPAEGQQMALFPFALSPCRLTSKVFVEVVRIALHCTTEFLYQNEDQS
jgi:hypothetical protein